MKTKISPALSIGIIVVVATLIGWFMYRSSFRQDMDTSASMSPELRAKFLGTHGSAPVQPGASSSSSTPTQGNR